MSVSGYSNQSVIRRRLRGRVLSMLGCLLAIGGCAPKDTATPQPHRGAANAQSGLFENVAERAGIRFHFTHGGAGRNYMLETTGSGCAVLDFNRDNLPDLFLLQAGPLPGARSNISGPRNRLYRNNGDGSFVDVTVGSGLEDTGYSQGVAVGDVDRDGFDDLYVTAYGGNHLFLNQGDGRFRDVTDRAGLADTRQGLRWDTSAAFGDYDGDGQLDLYVCRYVRWSLRTDKPCKNPLGQPSYCTPEIYEGDQHALFHNNGDGTFTDVSESAGITADIGRGLGVAWLDYNRDGHEDIFVANDLSPFFLWRNNGNGTFTNVGEEAGIAYGDLGNLLSGMGVAVRDYDRDGRDDVFVTNFPGQMNALFRGTGSPQFLNATLPSGAGPTSLQDLGFGCEFIDYDRNGWPDLLIGNGHVEPSVAAYSKEVQYAQAKSLLRNNGDGTFTRVQEELGALAVPHVTRGLAVADFDLDGHLDVVTVNQDGPTELLRYSGPEQGHWFALDTRGTVSNSNGYHARVTLTAGGQKHSAEVRSGSSYLSHSASRLYFGLGDATRVDEVLIAWHGSGGTTRATGLPVDRVYRAVEGRGIEALAR